MDCNKKCLLYGGLIGVSFTVVGFLIFYFVELNKKEIDNFYRYSLDKRQNVQINSFFASEYGDSFFVTVDLFGNAYLNVYGESDVLNGIREKYQSYSLTGAESVISDSIRAYKLDITGVLFVQNSSICSGDNCSFCIFVLENGELAYLSYGSLSLTGNVSVIKINGFKDIISIMPDGWVVDINGNEYKLPDDLY